MQLQHCCRCRGLLLRSCFVVALLSVLLVLAAGASDQENSGALSSGACERTTRTPAARIRTHCTTGPGRIDWQAAHG